MILRAHKITKQFNHPSPIELFSDLSLEIPQGSSTAIMGRSGEGKSTLLHMLGTLEPLTSGSLEICGQDVSYRSIPKLRNHKLGFIFQAYHLLEEDTLLDNVLMPAKIARTAKEARPLALDLIEAVGLSARLHYPVKLLSGGEKQRACLARAFCNSPEILFADEPTGNLDAQAAEQVRTLLFQLTQDLNKTLILVTHDPELAKLCDTTYVLDKARLCRQ